MTTDLEKFVEYIKTQARRYYNLSELCRAPANKEYFKGRAISYDMLVLDVRLLSRQRETLMTCPTCNGKVPSLAQRKKIWRT